MSVSYRDISKSTRVGFHLILIAELAAEGGKRGNGRTNPACRRDSLALDQPLTSTDGSGAYSLFGSRIYINARLALARARLFPLFVGACMGLDPQPLGLFFVTHTI